MGIGGSARDARVRLLCGLRGLGRFRRMGEGVC